MKIWVILFALFGQTAFAQHGANEIEVQERKRGAFGITPFLGSQWFTIQNANGDVSSYQGFGYGISGSLLLFGEPGQGMAVGFQYEGTVAPHTKIAGENLTASELSGFFEYQIGAASFVAVSFGSRDVEVETYEKSAEYNGRVLGIGAGLSLFSLTSSMDLGVIGWYKMALAAKSRNDNISSTLGDESFDILLGIRWTPEVSFKANQP